MEKRWVGCDPHNFRVGRPVGLRPDMIVLHSARGTVADATRTFFTSGSARSAHYLVATNGSITQHVQETDTAFHAGLKVNPSSSLVKSRPAINPNFYSIGIEHEGLPTNPQWSIGQVKASASLIGEIAIRWRIPLDSMHVVMHDAIRASANCPGPACDIDLLLRLASAEPGETTFEAAQSLTITARAN